MTSHEVVVATINTTRTRRGPVHDELDENTYPLGIAISKQELRQLRIQPHDHHGEWNYTIAPTDTRTAPVTADDRARNRADALRLLADARITGMSRPERSALAEKLAPAQQRRRIAGTEFGSPRHPLLLATDASPREACTTTSSDTVR